MKEKEHESALKRGLAVCEIAPEKHVQGHEKGGVTPVTLPHDWLIAQTDALYESGDGWYVNTLNNAVLDDCVLLDFDGACMDEDVLLNGESLGKGRWTAGTMRLILEGATRLASSTVSVRIAGDGEENTVSTCAFVQSERGKQAFRVEVPKVFARFPSYSCPAVSSIFKASALRPRIDRLFNSAYNILVSFFVMPFIPRKAG